MGIQEILRKERAPKEKAVAKAKAEHDKATQAAKKMEATAKATYDAKVTEAKKLVDTAGEALKAAESDLVDFDAQVSNFPGEAAAQKKGAPAKGKPAAAPAKAKGKPGPKASAKKAAPAKAKGKPGPKPGAKKAAKAEKLGAKKAEKPVATRPPVKDAMRLVMGRKSMSIKDVCEGLKTQKWVPDTSNLPGYVSALLSGAKNIFEAVSRGVYRVKSDAPPIAPAVKAHFGDAVKATQAAEPTTATPSAPKGRKAEPKAAASSEKKHGQHKCKKCGEPGHNAKGHDKWVAKQAAEAAKTSKPADPPAAEPKAAPAAKKTAKNVDDILAAEANQGGSSGLSAEMENAFGN